MKTLKNIDDWEISTPSGWSEFVGIQKIKKESCIKITFEDGTVLTSSEHHKFKNASGEWIIAKQLKRGMILQGVGEHTKKVKSKRKINKKTDLFDIIGVKENQEFYSNEIVSHNCAFIPAIEDLWTSAQQTIGTGGRAILLSTPNGTGNFFHKMWVDSEAKKNTFNTIQIKWDRHPERDQAWRDRQTMDLGPRKAAQECDTDFITSGNTVVDIKIIEDKAR